MKRIYATAICGIFLIGTLAVGGCAPMPASDGNAGTMAGPDGDESSTPTGEKLFTLIGQNDPYEQWAQFPDYEGTMPSALPHGPMSRVFINGLVESALDNFEGALPEGSIIVKENIGTSDGVTEAALTVMWKIQGFDRANNDWFWANMTTDGQVMAEGKLAACAACHGGARANDFVFVHGF